MMIAIKKLGIILQNSCYGDYSGNFSFGFNGYILAIKFKNENWVYKENQK